MATIPFVLYGIFRYLYRVHTRNVGGSPARELLADKPLLLTIASWGLAGAIIMRLGWRASGPGTLMMEPTVGEARQA
jgi:hypothetical protein